MIKNYILILFFRFINVSFKAIRDILELMPVIRTNIQRPPSAIGVDIMQEERQVHFLILNYWNYALMSLGIYFSF